MTRLYHCVRAIRLLLYGEVAHGGQFDVVYRIMCPKGDRFQYGNPRSLKCLIRRVSSNEGARPRISCDLVQRAMARRGIVICFRGEGIVFLVVAIRREL